MPSRALNPDLLTPGTIAIFETLREGEWVDISHVVDVAAPACAAHEHEAAIKNGRRVRRKVIASGRVVAEADLLTSGSRDLIKNRLMIAERSRRLIRDGSRVQLTEQTVSEWADVRGACDQRYLIEILPTPTEASAATTAATQPGAPQSTSTTRQPKGKRKPRLSLVPPVDADSSTTESTADISMAAPAAAVPAAIEAHGSEPDLDGFGWGMTLGRECTGLADHSGWADAPLLSFDSVHFRAKYRNLDRADMDALIAAMPEGCSLDYDQIDDLYRAECIVGTGPQARDAIRAWFAERDWEILQLRAETKPTRRRMISDLDPVWLSGLTGHASDYVKRITLKKHRAVLNQHFTDRSDMESLVGVWVVQAITIFDNEKSVPFGAFLNSKFAQWINDLNRKGYGRQATDDERNLRRAEREFTEAHSREPNDAEVAEVLGCDLEWVRKTRSTIAQMHNRRYWISLDSGDADHETDFGAQIHDDETAESHLDQMDARAEISRCLIAACAAEQDPARQRRRGNKGPNVLGLIAFYERFWGDGMSKKDLAVALGTTNKNMNAHAERVTQRMSTEFAHLIDS